MFGNETEEDLLMQSFILEEDVQEVVLRLMAPKKMDTKELRTI